MENNFAVITAKGNNLSLKDKNLILINGQPLIAYSIKAAMESKLITDVYVSTECTKIKSYCIDNNIKIIDRPSYLSQPESNHGDVIVHAYQTLKSIHGKVDSVVILLGNTLMTKANDIDFAISKMYESNDSTSCMTIWKAQDDHPYRAMKINGLGYLESFDKDLNSPSTNRQSYPDVYFYDQGPWVMRSSTLENTKENKSGPGPWWWMGEKCIPIIREWVTGRDVHGELDIALAEWWLNYN